ncbi:DUF917 domain-containing protein [Legionella sp. CNM-1927-20]|uniref:DUF917 domain-containing protein n=1 Tax=Legionella sp. CNM-1927-20 TaxID=3422221 RepID=UPI00403AD5C4
MLEINNENDVDALLLGLSFMGTGGGGTREMGKGLLMDCLNSGKKIKFVSLEVLEDNSLTACAYMMGSSSPMTHEKKQQMQAYGLVDIKVNNMQAAAIKTLEKFSNVKIDAIMPLELGAAASSGAISGAAWLDLPIIDADYMGRALPEISQTLPVIHNLPMLPLASVDKYGNEVIISNASSYTIAERLGKSVASASFDLAGQAAFLLSGKDIKPIALSGTISKAFDLGKTILKAQQNKSNVTEAIIQHFNNSAKVLFKGHIAKLESYEKDGYFYGENHINGSDEYSGNKFRVWFKNEHILSWINDKPYVSCPDLICIIDSSSGLPLLNGRMEIDQDITILGIPADKKLRFNKALELLNPKYFGFDFGYEPLK